MCAHCDNPYPGPVPFREDQGNLFFERELEAEDLFYIVLADRLVLFSAPSGAGKSSLINTRLRPALKKEGFDLFPTARVTGEVPPWVEDVRNAFVFDLIADIHADLIPDIHADPEVTQSALEPLVNLSLVEYLTHYRPACLNVSSSARKPQVLIIDQFEEIFTSHRRYWSQRADFFKQLGEAVASEAANLWVVLVMRQDHVNELERYTHLLPWRLRARYYMERLTSARAAAAIEKPAQVYDVAYAEDVVERLRRDLCREQDERNGRAIYEGEFVELVQLQVVCRQLWKELNPRAGQTITMKDLEEIAPAQDVTKFVSGALEGFYTDAIRATLQDEDLQQIAVSEYELRNWIGTRLISRSGRRTHAMRGPDETAEMPNDVIDALKRNHIVHEEISAGRRFVELIHDRLADPILDANRKWERRYPILSHYRDWQDAHSSPDRLLVGPTLQEAVDNNLGAVLGPKVANYIRQSQEAETTRKNQQRTRNVGSLLAALLVAVTLLLPILAFFWFEAESLNAIYLSEAAAAEFNRSHDSLAFYLAVESTNEFAGLGAPPTDALQILTDFRASAESQSLKSFDSLRETYESDIQKVIGSDDLRWIVAIFANSSEHYLLLQLDPEQGQFSEVGILASHADDPVRDIRFSPDSSMLAVVHENGLFQLFALPEKAPSTSVDMESRTSLEDLTTLDDTAVFMETNVAAFAFAAGGERLALAKSGGGTRLVCLDSSTHSPLTSYDLSCSKTPSVKVDSAAEEAPSPELTFSSDGQMLAQTGGTDGRLCLWEYDDGKEQWTPRPLPEENESYVHLAFGPTAQWLAATQAGKTAIRLWNLSGTGFATHSLAPENEPKVPATALVFGQMELGSENQPVTTLAVGYQDGEVLLWDLRKGSIVENPQATPTQTSLVPTRNAEEKDSSSTDSDALSEELSFDLRAHWLDYADPVVRMEFCAGDDDMLLTSIDESGMVRILALDKDRTTIVRRLYGCKQPIDQILWDADTNSFVTTSRKEVRVWQMEDLPDTRAERQALRQWACQNAKERPAPEQSEKYTGDRSYRYICDRIGEPIDSREEHDHEDSYHEPFTAANTRR